MSKELVSELRARAWHGRFYTEAADTIESQAAQIEALRDWYRTLIIQYSGPARAELEKALSITPSDALQQVKDRVREECAAVCDGFKGPHRAGVFNDELARSAAAIRNLKGQP